MTEYGLSQTLHYRYLIMNWTRYVSTPECRLSQTLIYGSIWTEPNINRQLNEPFIDLWLNPDWARYVSTVECRLIQIPIWIIPHPAVDMYLNQSTFSCRYVFESTAECGLRYIYIYSWVWTEPDIYTQLGVDWSRYVSTAGYGFDQIHIHCRVLSEPDTDMKQVETAK